MGRILTDQEYFEFGFNDIPPPEKRLKMSAERLAILLSKFDGRKAAQILVEHELQLRIAREQSLATWHAAILAGVGGIVATCIGVFLTSYVQSQHAGDQEAKRNTYHKDAQDNNRIQAPPIVQPITTSRGSQPSSSPASTILTTNQASGAGNRKP